MLSLYGAVALSLLGLVASQAGQRRNLTPDGFWHNRYFALLSMAAHGDYNTTCPAQSFTEEAKLSNFPDSPLAPWELLETWGPTESGCEGFSAIVPEMNKVVIVFKGNLSLLEDMPLDTVPWSYFGVNGTCQDCTVNRFAAQGYMEAKRATNDWEISRNRYYGAGLVYAITGADIGGMHALIHSVDYNNQRIAYYSHNQGTPRTFNAAGARWYENMFNGEAGERAIWNNDQTSDVIPSSEDYSHAGTPFKYWGFNVTSGQPNWHICWDDVDGADPMCHPAPQMQDGRMPTPEQDHYFMFTPVGQCGAPARYDFAMIDAYINNETTIPYEVAPRPSGTSTRRPAASPIAPQPAPTRTSIARAATSSLAPNFSSFPTPSSAFARWA